MNKYGQLGFTGTTLSESMLIVSYETVMSIEIYYKDNNPSEIDGSEADKNDGLPKRYTRAKKSRKVDMIVHLNIDICKQELEQR